MPTPTRSTCWRRTSGWSWSTTPGGRGGRRTSAHSSRPRRCRGRTLRRGHPCATTLMATAGALGRVQPRRPRTAALVVGSAKAKGTSLSENLARALSARLEAEGVTTVIHAATDFLREERARSAARAVAAADLFVLLTPLYVDAFPALATHALEYIAVARNESPAPAQFAAIVNCGFPEPEHIRTALRVARHFAAAAQYDWAGGLPLGGGGAVNPRTPLDAQHGPAMHVRSALESGGAVPGARRCNRDRRNRADGRLADARRRLSAHGRPGLAISGLQERPGAGRASRASARCERRTFNLSQVFAGQDVGVCQASDGRDLRIRPRWTDAEHRPRFSARPSDERWSTPRIRSHWTDAEHGPSVASTNERSDGRTPGFAPAGPMRSMRPSSSLDARKRWSNPRIRSR